MHVFKRGASLTCTSLALVAIVAASASAIDITPSNTAVLGTLAGGSNLVMTGTGVTIRCDTRMFDFYTGNRSSRGSIAAVNNVFHDTGLPPTSCVSNVGNFTISVRCPWTLTITSVSGTRSQGTVTVDADSCVTLHSDLLNCTLTINRSTYRVTYDSSTGVLDTDNPDTINVRGDRSLCLFATLTMSERLDLYADSSRRPPTVSP